MPGNLETSTNTRASRGNTALSAWVNECGDQGDEETNLADLITDLRHLSDAQGVDWHEILERSHRHYQGEVQDMGVATAIGDEEKSSGGPTP